jgi:hypothetical protein
MEEKIISDYTKLSPEEIADRLRRDAMPNSSVHEEIKGALLAVIATIQFIGKF